MTSKDQSARSTSPTGENALKRTLSMNSLIKTDSFTKLFKKSNKRSRSEDSDLDDIEAKLDIQASKKPRTRSSKEEEEFRRKEKEYDELLPPEYRKFRPKGFKLNLPPEDRPVRIYADGVFDLFHLGHMRQLEQCKKAFPNVTLVVGIPNDEETHKRKGLTVLTDKQRYETLRHCKWVDEVVEDAPWILNMKFLKDHKIDYCAHDDLPYQAQGIDDIYKPMKEAGMFLATQRTEGISTSDIITKIIRDYDKYLMRNFARGATRKELNVSWLKKNELDFKKQINDFRSYWKRTNDSLNSASRDLYTEVREFLKRRNETSPGQSPADSFASKFNGNGLGRTNSRRSLIENFRDWVARDSHSEFESDEEEKPVVTKRGRKVKKPASSEKKVLEKNSGK
ncbi:hypothetical protein KL936_002375 [Ogataea polymorpha]|nr:hypothetical protein KL936_002375 [Ogataea polymorpha]